MNKKIKVIELINTIVDAGAETIVKDIILNIDQRKYDVYLLTESANSTKYANVRAILEKNINIFCVYPLASGNFVNKLYRKLYQLLTPFSYRIKKQRDYIESSIMEICPDVIHVHLQMLQYLIPISEFLKEKNIRLIYSCYTVPSRYFNDESMKDNLRDAKYLVLNNNMRFTAMHESMKDDINQLFGLNNTVILRNGIDLSKYHDEISKSDARKQLGVPADSFLVGHLGRFVYIKNQRFLIDVFIEVLKYNKNAFLVMVGDGHDLKSIKNKLKQNGIENKYLILSHVDNLIWFYKALDVFVFPSLFEGIPNACIEAQAAGLKCLISSTITKDVFFSPQAIPANLADGPKAWANLIVDNNSKGPYLNNIEEFDFSKISSTIGKLYSE